MAEHIRNKQTIISQTEMLVLCNTGVLNCNNMSGDDGLRITLHYNNEYNYTVDQSHTGITRNTARMR
jgi:hypothetical protein